MKKITTFALLTILWLGIILPTASAQTYTAVAYNVENLFDADGMAVFNDYKPVDRNGNPQYTKEDVLTKVEHAVKIIQKYNNGQGPDVLMLAELEADFTHKPGTPRRDPQQFLKKYAGTTLKHMLGDGFNSEIKDLPSELLLLKGLYDAGIKDYDLQVGYNEFDNSGRPKQVQKNAVFTRLPIEKEKTRILPVYRARPILEVWLKVDNDELVVFANHWKSGAGSEEMEVIRIRDARVLKDELDRLRGLNPNLDFILGGDFNSDYNQVFRYTSMDETGINTILESTGNEQLVASGDTDKIYNLWYEYPVDKRGSDTYHGYWGTLMQLLISPGMYDYEGFRYVDHSFSVGEFKGMNVFDNSGEPKSWSSAGSGYGYSDHLPVSMQFRHVPTDKPGKKMELTDPGTEDNSHWNPIAVHYQKPDHYLTRNDIGGINLKQHPGYYDSYFYLPARITQNYDLVVNGEQYEVYAPGFNIKKLLKSFAGTSKTIHFYGRLSKYRGRWQFVIEDRSFLDL